VVVTLPQRPSEPIVRVPVGPPPKVIATPPDRASLARELQVELKRVGCYDGEINGIWTTSSRAAMKAFTERVNATLPIDAPDYILLSLVQGHQQKACGTSCPPGQVSAEEGRCVPNAVATTAASKPVPPEPKPAERPAPLITGSMSTAAAVAPAIAPLPKSSVAAPVPPRPEPATPPPSADRARAAYVVPPPQASPEPEMREERPPRAVRQSGPVPPAGVYENRRRRHVRRAPSRPPKFVRSLLRSVQRSLAPFGIR
jgi:hypothetical protein